MLLQLTDWKLHSADNHFDTREFGQVMINTADIAEIRPSGNTPPATRVTFTNPYREHLDVTETIAEIYGQQATLYGVKL